MFWSRRSQTIPQRLGVALSLCACSTGWAQSLQEPTRAGTIQAEVQAKKLAPDSPDKAERTFDVIEQIADRMFGAHGGFRPVIGGLVPGSGFAAGVEYFRPDLADGNVVFRTSARASVWRYEMLDGQVAFPHLLSDRAFADVSAVYRNYPSLNYYGPGPDSGKTGRTDYRLEDASFGFRAGLTPVRHLRLGVTGGYLRVNVGPGTNDELASTEKVYTEAEAPGIQFQSDFLRGGPFVEWDYRDHALDPHRGGYYTASYVYYDDLRLETGSHGKLKAETQQYIPFFNEKRVIALRAETELSYRNANQVVPFYLQPVLGGSEDLRGFRPFRFYDNNLFLMNAEYRWEVMSGLDMALFCDAGRVFHRHEDWSLGDVETSGGFGLRFKSRDAVVMRWDVGFSNEGVQVWIKFNNVF